MMEGNYLTKSLTLYVIGFLQTDLVGSQEVHILYTAIK